MLELLNWSFKECQLQWMFMDDCHCTNTCVNNCKICVYFSWHLLCILVLFHLNVHTCIFGFDDIQYSLVQLYKYNEYKGGVAQWVARLTRNVEVVGSSSTKGPRCFPEQEYLPLLLSTGLFQERIRAWFHNRTKIYWGPYGRFT